jgi:hypothetical protein
LVIGHEVRQTFILDPLEEGSVGDKAFACLCNQWLAGWHIMGTYRALLLSLVFVCFTGQAEEAPWQGHLQDGSQITIDPSTNKVTRESQGESNMLWDGVHQLDNGAVIIVRDGIVVKDNAILQLQQEQEKRQIEEACIVLVRKVCGPRNECEDHPACDPARQLLNMEQEELRTGWVESVPESSRRCLEAQINEAFFQPCTKRSAGMPLTPCEKLQQRVCGANHQCETSEACDAAKQLLEMELEDRYASPGGFSQSSDQCRDVLTDQGFFRACQ